MLLLDKVFQRRILGLHLNELSLEKLCLGGRLHLGQRVELVIDNLLAEVTCCRL